MVINNYSDIKTSLKEVRDNFYVNSKDEEIILEEVINLLIDVRKLLGFVVERGDEEINILKVLDTAFRRIIAEYVLSESGLIYESTIVMRNAIELIMIAIDITYSKESLNEWIISENDNIEEKGNWYFHRKKIYERIYNDKGNQIYPEWERNMVVNEIHSFNSEWKRLSNVSVHSHSKAQLINFYDSEGIFHLFSPKNLGEYWGNYQQRRIFIMTIISLMMSIEKYQQKLFNNCDYQIKFEDLWNRFNIIQEKMRNEYELVI